MLKVHSECSEPGTQEISQFGRQNKMHSSNALAWLLFSPGLHLRIMCNVYCVLVRRNPSQPMWKLQITKKSGDVDENGLVGLFDQISFATSVLSFWTSRQNCWWEILVRIVMEGYEEQISAMLGRYRCYISPGKHHGWQNKLRLSDTRSTWTHDTVLRHEFSWKITFLSCVPWYCIDWKGELIQSAGLISHAW